MSIPVAAPIRPTMRRATGAGIVAGLLTLALAGSTILQLEPGNDEAEVSSGLMLQIGNCLNLSTDGDQTVYQPVACSTPHDAQVVGIVEHPDAGRPFPGERVTAVWFERECQTASADFIGADVLATTLQPGMIMPTEEQWDDGTTHAICYVQVPVGGVPLEESVENSWQGYERGVEVAINRLMPGDCFDPPDNVEAYDLRSSDTVALVDCDGIFSGMFFGRGKLPFPAAAEIPDNDELTDASTNACANQFETFFEVGSSTGYTYRFWRPSRSSWDGGSRDVLCAVLSDTPVPGPFVPADYPRLYDLGSGQCFGLLPEQDAGTVSLDDRVRPIKCSEPHVGQMIGSGELNASGGFPGLVESSDMTESECRTLFEAFVGVMPSDSAYGEFPYWYPDNEAWNEGDSRYACAVLGDEILTASLQGSSS